MEEPKAMRTLTKDALSNQAKISPIPEPKLWLETLLTRKNQEMNDEKR